MTADSEPDDHELLREYTERRSEQAFARLVQRTGRAQGDAAEDIADAETSARGNRWEHDRYFPAYETRVSQLAKRTAGQ